MSDPEREKRVSREFQFWIPLVVSCLSLVGIGAFALADRPTVSEVRALISEAAPYVKDKPVIDRVILRYDDDRSRTAAQLESIRLEQAKMSNKIDQLLEGAGKGPKKWKR